MDSSSPSGRRFRERPDRSAWRGEGCNAQTAPARLKPAGSFRNVEVRLLFRAPLTRTSSISSALCTTDQRPPASRTPGRWSITARRLNDLKSLYAVLFGDVGWRTVRDTERRDLYTGNSQVHDSEPEWFLGAGAAPLDGESALASVGSRHSDRTPKRPSSEIHAGHRYAHPRRRGTRVVDCSDPVGPVRHRKRRPDCQEPRSVTPGLSINVTAAGASARGG